MTESDTERLTAIAARALTAGVRDHSQMVYDIDYLIDLVQRLQADLRHARHSANYYYAHCRYETGGSVPVGTSLELMYASRKAQAAAVPSDGWAVGQQSPLDDPFIVGAYEHRRCDSTCMVGWCGGGGFPKRCEQVDDEYNDCPGLVHASVAASAGDDFTLTTRCDVCGETGA